MSFGVLISKTNPLLSKNGNKYVNWKLSDLDGSSIQISLYATAYKERYTDPIGGVV